MGEWWEKRQEKKSEKANNIGGEEGGGGGGFGVSSDMILSGMSQITGAISQALRPEPINSADATAQQLQGAVSSVAKSFPPIGTAIGMAMDVMNAIPGSSINGSTMGNKAENIGNIAASILLPGAGFFTPKMREFEADKRLLESSSFAGSAKAAQEAQSHAGGKFLFGRQRIKGKMDKIASQQNRALNILEEADLAKSAAAQQTNTLRMQNMLGGGSSPNSFVVGKKGLKIPENHITFAKRVLSLDPFESFKRTLPVNLQSSEDYNIKRLWELTGKPLSATQLIKDGVITLNKEDYLFHAPSVALNKDTGEYEFLKAKNHPTLQEELDWFNSMDASEFREKYDLDISGPYYKYIPKKDIVEVLEELPIVEEISSFKNGGSFNIIPEGALHKNKHNLDKIDDKFKDVTTKGIPVISEDEGGKITQHAEIEKEEIIFYLEVTTKLEELAKDGSDKAAIEAGELLVQEILYNTKDLTKKLL
jgi:hypothetical protein